MQIPFEPIVFGVELNVHLILEYLAFFMAFRWYVYQRKVNGDQLNKSTRISIVLGAIVGALVGSRLIAYLENPFPITDSVELIQMLNSKTIMGGLFGGLLGVEIAKKIIGESRSSGDLFTLPIILGIIIGRIGCFLNGINEFTYGSETICWTGMNLGDGLLRHPIALYEIIFLLGLYIILNSVRKKGKLGSGALFVLFMLSYFGFRFLIEFIKPNVFFFAGLSSIQWLCIICYLYYSGTIVNWIANARKKVYIL